MLTTLPVTMPFSVPQCDRTHLHLHAAPAPVSVKNKTHAVGRLETKLNETPIVHATK
jgi:hypothetical protein